MVQHSRVVILSKLIVQRTINAVKDLRLFVFLACLNPES